MPSAVHGSRSIVSRLTDASDHLPAALYEREQSVGPPIETTIVLGCVILHDILDHYRDSHCMLCVMLIVVDCTKGHSYA
eukprot:scaffold388968_cov55-Prasinocladus_malaysianus.AAC.1